MWSGLLTPTTCGGGVISLPLQVNQLKFFTSLPLIEKKKKKSDHLRFWFRMGGSIGGRSDSADFWSFICPIRWVNQWCTTCESNLMICTEGEMEQKKKKTMLKWTVSSCWQFFTLSKQATAIFKGYKNQRASWGNKAKRNYSEHQKLAELVWMENITPTMSYRNFTVAVGKLK